MSELASAMQAGSLAADLQEHSMRGGSLSLQLPTSRRVPLEGAELAAYQEQKRKEEMIVHAQPSQLTSKASEPLPTRCVHSDCCYCMHCCSCTEGARHTAHKASVNLQLL